MGDRAGAADGAMRDFNAELHARPSLYFSGLAVIDHVSISTPHIAIAELGSGGAGFGRLPDSDVRYSVERHTEFVTVTTVAPLAAELQHWPNTPAYWLAIPGLAALPDEDVVCRVRILVCLGRESLSIDELEAYGLRQAAGSAIGGGDAIVVSDFVVQNGVSRIILFNKNLKECRLGRMVRRLCEIETYRSMSLKGFPVARNLAPVLVEYDTELTKLADRHISVEGTQHRQLLADVTELSARIVSDAARTRNRFGATAAYAKIVEDRIAELREARLPGCQRYGVFIDRRFRPAVRTCAATASRLEQMAMAADHLIEILQTRIQVAVQDQNREQLELLAKRAETQVKIQRSVEGLSAIAIGYYLIGLIKVCIEALQHAGVDMPDYSMLVAVPIALVATLLAVISLKRVLSK
jgi:uncharacterized membrane-anchored protein